MRWSQFFIPTSRELPADAVVSSHQLMLRSGLIRQVVAGAYTYLPLGCKALRKIEEIVRKEMNRAGAIELHMPALQPIEWWEETGRVAAMGDVLLRLRGASADDWRSRTVLGPTHEEVITEIARAYINSYKQLPINLYQIQTKFRGESRPKSGVLRTREFLMKDAYSFHKSKNGQGGLDEGYQKMYDAYCAIFSRCGLPYIAVEADSGPIGGDASHEFMVPTDAGEDYLVQSEDGKYAANLERAQVAPLSGDGRNGSSPLIEIDTPGVSTIVDLTAQLKCQPKDIIKTIVFEVGKDEPLVALVRGDHEVNELKLRRIAGVNYLAPASPELIRKATGAEVGFSGPIGLRTRVVADQAVTIMRDAVSGANKTDYHITGVNPGRDFEIKESGDIRSAVEGDRAPNGSPLTFKKCIEVGHVFKLGTKYSELMRATYIDQEGKMRPFVMGCYGIGLNRIMAAALETSHDQNGITWPIAIAPFSVIISALDLRIPKVVSVANSIYAALEKSGIDVLFDDREDVRAGAKLMDADLLGLPIRITVGKKGLEVDMVEVQRRSDQSAHRVAPTQVEPVVRSLLSEET